MSYGERCESDPYCWTPPRRGSIPSRVGELALSRASSPEGGVRIPSPVEGQAPCQDEELARSGLDASVFYTSAGGGVYLSQGSYVSGMPLAEDGLAGSPKTGEIGGSLAISPTAFGEPPIPSPIPKLKRCSTFRAALATEVGPCFEGEARAVGGPVSGASLFQQCIGGVQKVGRTLYRVHGAYARL